MSECDVADDQVSTECGPAKCNTCRQVNASFSCQQCHIPVCQSCRDVIHRQHDTRRISFSNNDEILRQMSTDVTRLEKLIVDCKTFFSDVLEPLQAWYFPAFEAACRVVLPRPGKYPLSHVQQYIRYREELLDVNRTTGYLIDVIEKRVCRYQDELIKLIVGAPEAAKYLDIDGEHLEACRWLARSGELLDIDYVSAARDQITTVDLHIPSLPWPIPSARYIVDETPSHEEAGCLEGVVLIKDDIYGKSVEELESAEVTRALLRELKREYARRARQQQQQQQLRMRRPEPRSIQSTDDHSSAMKMRKFKLTPQSPPSSSRSADNTNSPVVPNQQHHSSSASESDYRDSGRYNSKTSGARVYNDAVGKPESASTPPAASSPVPRAASACGHAADNDDDDYWIPVFGTPPRRPSDDRCAWDGDNESSLPDANIRIPKRPTALTSSAPPKSSSMLLTAAVARRKSPATAEPNAEMTRKESDGRLSRTQPAQRDDNSSCSSGWQHSRNALGESDNIATSSVQRSVPGTSNIKALDIDEAAIASQRPPKISSLLLIAAAYQSMGIDDDDDDGHAVGLEWQEINGANVEMQAAETPASLLNDVTVGHRDEAETHYSEPGKQFNGIHHAAADVDLVSDVGMKTVGKIPGRGEPNSGILSPIQSASMKAACSDNFDFSCVNNSGATDVVATEATASS